MVCTKTKIKKGDLDRPLDVQRAEDLEHLRQAVMLLVLLLMGFMSFSLSPRPGAFFASDEDRDRDPEHDNVTQVVSCYYALPAGDAAQPLWPADIHPHLCTHINAAFAQIRDGEIYLEEHQRQTIADIVKLKESNPNLKVLLSVGGAGSHSGFQDMVFNHTCRKVFIRSIKNELRNLSLDGIDLDWEFPVVEFQSEVSKRERQHFSQLLREIRMEYRREKKKYLLTVAAAAPEIIVDAAYDVDQMNLYVDYVNIMTYDFHTYTQFTPLTGLNSPLFRRPSEQLYLATLNINYTVDMYKRKGLHPTKIVVGIPTYGHTFSLVNSENTNVGSPALGYGSLGQLGFVNYPDICSYLHNFQNETTINVDKDAKVPYFFRNSEWVSYENPESVAEKAKYIRSNNLRGAMIYSLNADDYMGVCGLAGRGKFPLASSVRSILNSSYNSVDTLKSFEMGKLKEYVNVPLRQ